jgi:ribosomal protein S18 acetylase RimI-like enzyme
MAVHITIGLDLVMEINNRVALGANFRRAADGDRASIAKLIAQAYAEDFLQITKKLDRVAEVFENALIVDKFFVGEVDEKVVAITAVTDSVSRAVKFNRHVLRKKLGFVRGAVFDAVMKSVLEKPIPLDAETLNIEFVAVCEGYRGYGLSGKLIEHIIKTEPKRRFVLDVKDNNTPAIKTYEKLGFTVYKREKVNRRTHGCDYLLYMEFNKNVLVSSRRNGGSNVVL